MIAVLHLRLICPPDRTAKVMDVLDRSVGVAHMVVFPGAAVRPAGDVVEADLARRVRGRDAHRAGVVGPGRAHSRWPSVSLQLVVSLVGIVVAAALTLLVALRLRRREP